MPGSNSNKDKDDFFSISTDLQQLPVIKQPGTTSLDFDGLLQNPIRLHEDLAKGCGGQLWPAGMVLAKYILQQHRDGFKDKSIVEIGAGGGLVGLAVARGCPDFKEPLYITDQESMLHLMQQNIERNDLGARVQAQIYNWGEPCPYIPPQPDVILAADCVYFEPAFPFLHETLKDLIGNHSVCYFCFKKRRRADLHFVKSIRKTFDVEAITDDPDKEAYSKENIFLLKIRKRRD